MNKHETIVELKMFLIRSQNMARLGSNKYFSSVVKTC